MKYYYGNSYKEAVSNNPVEIPTTEILQQYQECYNVVIPVEGNADIAWQNDQTIMAMAQYSIDDILSEPEHYVDPSQDLVLLKFIPSGTLLMIGQDEESDQYYFTVEDNETSEDIEVDNKEELAETFQQIIREIQEDN